ncbi:MAG: hypothetical protein SFW36_01275 [Leptolyngbyaceae cyanobacterium bins.59]|nr:hypothetical protein [Leptolyngbyaceae cyanobacterium bins.59]
MSKPLGYYLNSCTGDYAQDLQGKIEDLSTEDVYGLFEWLTHYARSEHERILGEWEELEGRLNEAALSKSNLTNP